MVELKSILKERRTTLDTLMTELLISEIKEREVIFFNSNDMLNSSLCNAFLKRFDNYVGHFIYSIDLVNESDLLKAQNSFKAYYKSNKIARDTLKRNTSKFNAIKSKVLYVGVNQIYLKEKIKQHLGCGASLALALHLKYWLPENIELKISIYEIDSESKEFANFLEQGFWGTLKPMFGGRKDV